VRFRLGQFLETSPVPRIAQDEIGAPVAAGDEAGEGEQHLRRAGGDRRDHMVSRAIKPGDILRGIHESMAERMIKLLKSIDVKRGMVMMTGGLALDAGLVKPSRTDGRAEDGDGRVAAHADSCTPARSGRPVGRLRHGS